MYAIAFDLDGVIADWSHRLPLIQPTNGMVSDWHSFYEAMPDDPTLPGAVVYNLLANQSAMIQQAVIAKALNIDIPCVDVLTCRPEKMRAVTLEWFERNGLMLPRAMHMRADDDDRPHAEIKVEMWRQHYESDELLGIFEDNAAAIAAFKELGVATFHVA